MVSLHIRLGTFGTRADMLADLNLSGNKRHLAFYFNRQSFRVGRIIYDIHNTACILHAEIILFAAEANAAALIGLPGLTMEKR